MRKFPRNIMNIERLKKQIKIDYKLKKPEDFIAEGILACKSYFPEWDTYPDWLQEVLINYHKEFTKPFCIAMYTRQYDDGADVIGDSTPRHFRLSQRLRNKC